jgi:hypothetical protein
MTICPNGHQNPDGPRFCGDCGAAIAAPPPTCPNGHQNPDGRKFCGVCGAATVGVPSPATPARPLPRAAAGWYPDPTGNAGQRYWDGQGWQNAPTPLPATPSQPPVTTTDQSGRRAVAFALAASTLLAIAAPFALNFAIVQGAACPKRGAPGDVTVTCILVEPWSHIPYILGVLVFSTAIAVVGGAFAFRWGLSRARIAVFAIGTVAISLAIALTGVADVHHSFVPSGHSDSYNKGRQWASDNKDTASVQVSLVGIDFECHQFALQQAQGLDAQEWIQGCKDGLTKVLSTTGGNN